MLSNSFKSIEQAVKGLVFKDKKSKFFGYAFPVEGTAEIKLHLEKLRLDHSAARHFCYAWRLGIGDGRHKANDDGEPHNSAGQPILGQIRAFGLTDVLVVVVRYYGGTKLGVGGLVNAYRTAARYVLEEAVILEKELKTSYRLRCEHAWTGKVLHIIKKNCWEILSREVEEYYEIIISVRDSDSEKLKSELISMPNLFLEKLKQK